MKSNPSPTEDIKEIRKLMEQSSKFLSLSGLSGISAGIITFIGAGLMYMYLIYNNITYYELVSTPQRGYDDSVIKTLLFTAVSILLLAILSGFYFSYRKAKKLKVPFWNPAAIRMLVNLFIPIISGGLVIIILIIQKLLFLAVPMTLIFYGLGLINAGKYSRADIHFLGFFQIILGLFAMIFISYALLFWIVGFGILHVAYGAYLYLKYD